jgi:N-methylhydantoinase B/oxoprolinase/acetone carboxylase alpha subunit
MNKTDRNARAAINTSLMLGAAKEALADERAKVAALMAAIARLLATDPEDGANEADRVWHALAITAAKDTLKKAGGG